MMASPNDDHKSNWIACDFNFIKSQTYIYEQIVNHIQSQHPDLDINSVNIIARKYIRCQLREDPETLLAALKPEMFGNEKASTSIEIDMCPKDISLSDFLIYTNVKEYVRKEASSKYDLSEEQIEEIVANVYQRRLIKLNKWPKDIAFVDGTIRTLDDFKRFKMEIEKKKTATEAKLSIPTHRHLAIDVPSTSRNNTKTQSQLPDSTPIARTEQAVSNTSAGKAIYSSKSETDRIRILPKDISLEDFKQLTNIEDLMRSDIISNKKPTSYLKAIDKHIRKYYERRFVNLPVWPIQIVFQDSSIRTLEDIQRLKCQKLEGSKKQVELPIEASTAKGIEKETILGEHRKLVLNSTSTSNRHITADIEKTQEEPIEMEADLNLSPELFPSSNETANGENPASLPSQINEAFVFCDPDSISKDHSTTLFRSQICDPLSLGSADLPISLNCLSARGQCETSIPVKTDNTLFQKSPINDKEDTLDYLGNSETGSETIIPDKEPENNSYDLDNSTTTEIFSYRPVKRKANAISLHSSDITLDTTSIKVKQENEIPTNESLAVATGSDLQIVRTIVESMKSEVTAEEIAAETNKCLAVGIIHDSPSDVSGRQSRSNSSPDYVQRDEAIAAKIIEKDAVNTKSDSLVIIERDATERPRKSENLSKSFLAPESSKSKGKPIEKRISPLVENEAAIENNPVKRSVEQIASKSHSHQNSGNADARSDTNLGTTENQSDIYKHIASTAASECVRVLNTEDRVINTPATQNIDAKHPSTNNIENVNLQQNKDRRTKEEDIIFKIPQTILRHGKNSRKVCKEAVIKQQNSDKITSMMKQTNVLRKLFVAECSSSSKNAKNPKKVIETSDLQEIIVPQAKHTFQPLPLVSRFKNGNSISHETAKRKASGQPSTQHKKKKLSSTDPDYFIEDSSQASLDLSEITIEKDENEPKVSVNSPSFEMANTKSCTVALNVINWEFLEEVAKFNNHIMKPCLKYLQPYLSHITTISLGSIPNSLVSSIYYTSTYALLNFPAKLRFQSKTVLIRDETYNFDIFEPSLRFAVSISASKEKDLLELLAVIKSRGSLSYCSPCVQAVWICALQAILSRFKYFTLIRMEEKVNYHDHSLTKSAFVIPHKKRFNSAAALMYKTLEVLNGPKN